jgi:NADP-dependent 3-hydroxy acid dehydrogenase YdfG
MKIAITGTTSGLGLALRECLQINHDVFVIDKPTINLNSLSDLQTIDLSGIDVLINNAGHSHGGGTGILTHDVEAWSDILDVNLRAPIYLTQKFIQQNLTGKIIFITSRAVESSMGGDSIYSASKAGLTTFIQCMRDELKNSNYQLIEIRPGRIKTSFAKNRGIHNDQTIDSFYDTRQHMTVDEVVKVINSAIELDYIETITLTKNA